MDTTSAAGQIEAFRALHQRLSLRFLATFLAVPEDKLTWRAAPTAKNALEIGAHVAGSHRFFLAVHRGEDVPPGFEGAMQLINEKSAEYTTREQIVECIKTSRKAMDEVYESGINFEAYSASEDYRFIVRLPSFHCETHSGQIDFLQTCWGDMEMHYVPVS